MAREPGGPLEKVRQDIMGRYYFSRREVEALARSLEPPPDEPPADSD